MKKESLLADRRPPAPAVSFSRRSFIQSLIAGAAASTLPRRPKPEPEHKGFAMAPDTHPIRLGRDIAALNGEWEWINIASESGAVGNFCGRFRMFPEPDPKISELFSRMESET